MLFVLTCRDKPGALPLRMQARPEHLAHLERHAAGIVSAGPLLDDSGQPCGSSFVLDVPDRVAAEAFAANDPYALAGVFDRVELHAFRYVYRDGKKVA